MTTDYSAMMPFAKLMGVTFVEATPARIEAVMEVRDDLTTGGGIMHGGAIMAFADSVGAVGAVLTLPEGAKGTTTIESKTNFLAGAKVGSTVTAVAEPVKTGRRMSVWQTRITDQDGRDIALVTQTQLVL